MWLWSRPCWCRGHGYGGAARVLVWRARRSAAVRWTLLGLILVLLTVGVAIARRPTPVDMPIALPSAPLAVATDALAHRLYVATADDRVWALDTSSERIVGAVAVGGAPVAVAVNPASGRVYVATVNGLTVLTAGAATVRTSVALEQPPTALAVDPALDRVYVTTVAFQHGLGSGRLVVVDARRDAVVASLPIGVNPQGLAVDSRTQRLYVADAGSGSIIALSGESLAVQATIPVGGAPYRVSVDPQAGRVYVTDRDAPILWVLDETSNTVQSSVPVGQHPAGVAVDPATGRIFVANGGEGSVAVLRGSEAMPLVTLPVGAQPAGLAVDAGAGRVYVTDFGERSVWLHQEHRFGSPGVRLFARAVAPTSGTDDVRATPPDGERIPASPTRS
jgi:YVTN family beta-propeller protein